MFEYGKEGYAQRKQTGGGGRRGPEWYGRARKGSKVGEKKPFCMTYGS
jgi:hypothetical protein